ncbi:hypothetical protein DFH06DRAFT_1139886 [Mycena polygramma]|nr:hypothetical protein DFH06DRAFT_1139886 [Mycena polygramma]
MKSDDRWECAEFYLKRMVHGTAWQKGRKYHYKCSRGGVRRGSEIKNGSSSPLPGFSARIMHCALQIPELVELIAEQLGDSPSQRSSWHVPKSSRRDLSALARTSKSFLDSALDVLWRNQDTLLNLLRCMPADLWCINECANEDGWPTFVFTIHLQRTILPADWERPLFYLYRVKSLSLGDEYLFESLDFFEGLDLCLPTEHMFPNLEKLVWIPESGEAFHHVRLFLAPQLKDLCLGSIRSVPHLSIFSTLAIRCPYLTNLCVYTPLAELSSMSAFVRASSRLQLIAVPGLDAAAIAHIATPPDLRSMTLWRQPAYESPPQPSARTVLFPSLTRLTTATMDDCVSVLHNLVEHSSNFVGTHTVGRKTTTTVAHQFYSALARHCSHSSLQKLIVHEDRDFPKTLSTDAYSLYAVDGVILKPLLSFTNLVHVRSHVTLEGLYAFVPLCPVLRVLEITIDATSIPNAAIIKRTQHSLRSLDVALSPITKPRRVAKFLSATFPNLYKIGTIHDRETVPAVVDGTNVLRLHVLWKNVEDAL